MTADILALMNLSHSTTQIFVFMRRPIPNWAKELFLFALVCIAAIATGFLLSFPGILMWDDHYRINHSTSIMKAFGLLGYEKTEWSYAPLWELTLGIGQHYVFFWLHDEIWVRHSLTFALFPISIYLTYKLLRRAGTDPSTALFGASSILAIIRLGGHSLFNTKDVPGALTYLISSLVLWVVLREGCSKPQGSHFSVRSLCIVGVVSTLPFLTRSPLLVHLILLEIALISVSMFEGRKVDAITRFTTPLIPLLAGCLFIFLLYPPMWQQSEQLDGSVAISAFLVLSLLAFLTTYVMWTFRNKWKGLMRIAIPVGIAAVFLAVIITNLSVITGLLQQVNQSFQDPYAEFSDFGWTGSTIVFGRKLPVENLPWWYAFAWLPVIAHPMVLFSALIGYVSLLFHRKSAGDICRLPLWGGRSVRLSLERWLWIIVCLSFAAIAVIRPTLYNDERHILFLYPVFFLLGVLGLDFLHRWIKYALAAVLIIVSLISYGGWGRYSYSYASSVIPEQYRVFTGDYWAICMSDATAALSGNVPKGSIVRVDGPKHLAFMQADRLQNTQALSYDPHFDYKLVGGNDFPSDDERPFAVMTNTLVSVYYYKRVQEDLETGNAIPVLVRRDPFGKPICILAYYPPLEKEEVVSEE